MNAKTFLQAGLGALIHITSISSADAQAIPQALPSALFTSLVAAYPDDSVRAKSLAVFQEATTVEMAYGVAKPYKDQAEDKVDQVSKGYLFLLSSALRQSSDNDLKADHPARILSGLFTASDRKAALSLTPSEWANGENLTAAQSELRKKLQNLRKTRKFDTLDPYSANVTLPRFASVWETIRACYDFTYSDGRASVPTGQEVGPLFRAICGMNDRHLDCGRRKTDVEPERLTNSRSLKFPKSFRFAEARPKWINVDAKLRDECAN